MQSELLKGIYRGEENTLGTNVIKQNILVDLLKDSGIGFYKNEANTATSTPVTKQTPKLDE